MYIVLLEKFEEFFSCEKFESRYSDIEYIHLITY